MKNKYSKYTVLLTVTLMIASIFLSLGVTNIFTGCTGLKEDGNYMRCHWAQNAIALVAGGTACMYLIGIFIKKHAIRKGILIGGIINNIVMIILANNTVIKLCMSKEMHCWTHMKPTVTMISTTIIIIAVINYIFINRLQKLEGASI